MRNDTSSYWYRFLEMRRRNCNDAAKINRRCRSRGSQRAAGARAADGVLAMDELQEGDEVVPAVVQVDHYIMLRLSSHLCFLLPRSSGAGRYILLVLATGVREEGVRGSWMSSPVAGVAAPPRRKGGSATACTRLPSPGWSNRHQLVHFSHYSVPGRQQVRCFLLHTRRLGPI